MIGSALRRLARVRPLMRMLLVSAPLLLAGCHVDLYSGLSEQEANEILAVLMRARIEARRVVDKDGQSTIQVEEAQLADAVDILTERGYPRHQHSTMADVFEGDGFIQSQTEEHARFIFALGEELSRTVSDIDGVISARVHVVLPRNDPLRNNSSPSSASVFIRHDALVPVENLLPQIKMLIANSIEGLSYDKVAVIFVPVELEDLEIRAANAVMEAEALRDTAFAPRGGGAGAAEPQLYAATALPKILGTNWLPLLLAGLGAFMSVAALVVALVRGHRRAET